MSFLEKVHVKIVKFVQNARISVQAMNIGLNFDNLSIRSTTRSYFHEPVQVKPTNKWQSYQSNATINKYGISTNKYGTTNKYADGRGPTRFKQGSQVINRDKSTKWNGKLGPFMKPTNRSKVISLGFNLPKGNVSECCMAFHAKGECQNQCARENSHVALNGQQKVQYFKYCDELQKSN